MSPRSWQIRVQDILRAIDEIEEFILVHETQESFQKDIKTIRAVTACLTVIGEASNHIPLSIKEQYSEVRWEQIRGMQNRIAHEYFSVDDAVIWKTVKERLPVFKIQLKKILDSSPE